MSALLGVHEPLVVGVDRHDFQQVVQVTHAEHGVELAQRRQARGDDHRHRARHVQVLGESVRWLADDAELKRATSLEKSTWSPKMRLRRYSRVPISSMLSSKSCVVIPRLAGSGTTSM